MHKLIIGWEHLRDSPFLSTIIANDIDTCPNVDDGWNSDVLATYRESDTLEVR